MSDLSDGWYLAVKGHSDVKGPHIRVVHVSKGNYGVIGRLATAREFKDYRFIPFDLEAAVEYAELLEKLW